MSTRKPTQPSGRVVCLGVLLLVTVGCSGIASWVSSPHDTDPVVSRMSANINLPKASNQKCLFLQIQGYPYITALEKTLKHAFESKGYQVVYLPEEADYLLQVNRKLEGVFTVDIAQALLHDGYGAKIPKQLVANETTLAMKVQQKQTSDGAWHDTLKPWKWDWDWLSHWVDKGKHVTYIQVLDIQISEKIIDPGLLEKSMINQKHRMVFPKQWHRYQTRFVSMLQQDYRDKQDADAYLMRHLVRQLVALF